MLRVTLKNAKSSSQRGLKRYSFDYSTSKDTMRAYNGDKYLEQWKKNKGKTFEGKWEAFIQPKLDGNRCCFDVKNKKMYSCENGYVFFGIARFRRWGLRWCGLTGGTPPTTGVSKFLLF